MPQTTQRAVCFGIESAIGRSRVRQSLTAEGVVRFLKKRQPDHSVVARGEKVFSTGCVFLEQFRKSVLRTGRVVRGLEQAQEKTHFRFLTTPRRAKRNPHTPKRKSLNQPLPLLPMPDTEPDEKDRKEPNGTTLTLEEWIEELNTCDRLHQYAKKRKRESEEG